MRSIALPAEDPNAPEVRWGVGWAVVVVVMCVYVVGGWWVGGVGGGGGARSALVSGTWRAGSPAWTSAGMPFQRR